MKKIVLLEFIDEFDTFCSYIRNRGLQMKDFLLIALEVKLQAYLMDKGIAHENTLAYFDSASHRQIITETEKTMVHIRENFDFADTNGLKACYKTEFMHHIRLYQSHMYRIIEIIKNIYKRNKDCEFYACVYHGSGPSYMITNSDRYLGVLTERFSKNNAIKFTNCNLISRSLKPTEIARPRIRFLEKIITRTSLCLLRSKQIVFVPRLGNFLKRLMDEMSEKYKGTRFLAIDYHGSLLNMIVFNLVTFFKGIYKEGPARHYILNTDFLHETVNDEDHMSLRECIDSMVDTKVLSLYEYRAVSCFDLIKERVDSGLRRHMRWLLQQAYNLRSLCQGIENKIVISNSGSNILAVVGELARLDGFRALFISHGTHPVPIDLCHEMELLNLCKTFMLGSYTDVALSVPTQEAHLHYFKKRYSDIDNRELKIDPIFFANVNRNDKPIYRSRLGLSNDDIVLVHATSMKRRKGPRFLFIETFDEFFSSLHDILNTIEDIERMKLIIRLHPGFYLADSEIRMLLPKSDRFIIHREGLFEEALAASDILISYSSTAIDEALINRIPVLLYDKWNRYNHFNTGIFCNRYSQDIFPVCYVNNKETLGSALNFISDNIKQPKTNNNGGFDTYRYKEDYSNGLAGFLQGSFK